MRSSKEAEEQPETVEDEGSTTFCESSVMKASGEAQSDLVALLSYMLVSMNFGIAVPVLVLIAPIGLWFQLLARQWFLATNIASSEQYGLLHLLAGRVCCPPLPFRTGSGIIYVIALIIAYDSDFKLVQFWCLAALCLVDASLLLYLDCRASRTRVTEPICDDVPDLEPMTDPYGEGAVIEMKGDMHEMESVASPLSATPRTSSTPPATPLEPGPSRLLSCVGFSRDGFKIEVQRSNGFIESCSNAP